MKVLTGLRVTDFTWGIVGTVATKQLALMGAEVIKIESGKRLDFCRTMPAPMTQENLGVNRAPQFNDSNHNKLSVLIDLSHPKGKDLAKKLISISDVVTENFTPGVMQRLGLDYQAVSECKPDIVMASMSASGSAGPESTYMGYAPLFAAIAGLSDLTGYSDGPPSEVRASGDQINAFHAVVAILAALIHRQRTGKGQYIDYSSVEGLVCCIGESIMHYTMNGEVPTRNGNRDDIMAPHGCYLCKGNDAWISIAISTEEEWQALCNAMRNPTWTTDKKFIGVKNRWDNQEELDTLVNKWTKDYTPHEAMQLLKGTGVAAFPSYSAKDVFEDRHLEERKAFKVVDHPEDGARFIIAPPWKLTVTPPDITRHSPLLGQDNEYVFREILKLPREEIDKLIEEEVIV